MSSATDEMEKRTPQIITPLAKSILGNNGYGNEQCCLFYTRQISIRIFSMLTLGQKYPGEQVLGFHEETAFACVLSEYLFQIRLSCLHINQMDVRLTRILPVDD